MNLKSYLKSWEGTQNENKWGRMFIAGLIVAVLVLIGMLANKQTIVTIQPFTLHDEAWVTEDDSSQGYKEAWGFALAQLFGNVTPSNVGFIKDHVVCCLQNRLQWCLYFRFKNLFHFCHEM